MKLEGAVFFYQFLVNLLLILGTNRLTGYSGRNWRSVLAAALAGVYATVCLLRKFWFLGAPAWRGVSFLVIGLTAFGPGKTGLSGSAVYILLQLALEGMAVNSPKGGYGMVLWGAALYLLCRIGFSSGFLGQEFVEVKLNYSGRTHTLRALRDTGNRLTDPITGERVFVAGADVGVQILGLKREDFRDPAKTLVREQVPGLRLIPYSTADQCGALMLALRFPNTLVGRKKRDVMVAFAPENIGGKEGYRMVTGGAL